MLDLVQTVVEACRGCRLSAATIEHNVNRCGYRVFLHCIVWDVVGTGGWVWFLHSLMINESTLGLWSAMIAPYIDNRCGV